MPHRRHFHSKRKFKDGMYRLLSSHAGRDSLSFHLDQYREMGGPKLRYVKGSDGKYHIYEKLEE